MPDHSLYTLGQKFFIKISLSHLFSLKNGFLCFMQNFKMPPPQKNGRKMIYITEIALPCTIPKINEFLVKFKIATKMAGKQMWQNLLNDSLHSLFFKKFHQNHSILHCFLDKCLLCVLCRISRLPPKLAGKFWHKVPGDSEYPGGENFRQIHLALLPRQVN